MSQRPVALRAAMQQVEMPVVFRRLRWGEASGALRRGSVDVHISRLPIDLKGLQHRAIFVEPRKLCLPANHRLARRKQVRLSDIGDVPIVIPIGGTRDWQSYWRGMPRPDGRSPPGGPEVHSPKDTYAVVLSGAAACFVPSSMAPPSADGQVRFIDVEELAPSEFAVVWSGTPRAWLEAYIAAAANLTKNPGT